MISKREPEPPATKKRVSRELPSTKKKIAKRARSSNSLAKDASLEAEDAAMAALASGLRIAAALGTVAAKTASIALSSLASGANTFAELVREETVGSPKKSSASKRTAKLSRLSEKEQPSRKRLHRT